ncbi:MAG: hypothetical protein AAFY36_05510 [Bacteroidota bacterium]
MKASVNSFPLFMLLLFACTADDDSNQPLERTPTEFIDGFETTNGLIADLFPSDGSRWTNIQQVNPGTGDNLIELDNTLFSEGTSSLKIISQPSDNTLSKIDIEKAGFFAETGSTVIIEADFYIDGDGPLTDLFLIDLECCSCWDSDVPNNQCPGIRLKMSGDNNFLFIERGKILGSTLQQTDLPFPLNEWVSVRWQMQLHPNNNGENILAINGQEVINTAGKNQPNADEFRSEFAANNIDFELQEPLGYERLQIGATANPTTSQIVLYIDNFKLLIE